MQFVSREAPGLFVEIRLSVKEGDSVTLIYYSNEVTNPIILTKLSETLHNTNQVQYAATMRYSVVCYNILPSFARFSFFFLLLK